MRKMVGGLLVLAASTACAPWGPVVVAGGLAGAAAEVQDSGPTTRRSIRAPGTGSRPKLGEIFRDGRYEFSPAPPAIQRAAEREFRSDPIADAALKKVAVKIARDGSSGAQFLTFAIVWSGAAAAEYPETWEGFLEGYAGDAGVELKRGRLRGVEVAVGRQPDAKVVLIDYDRGVTLMVVGEPTDPTGPLKDLARYLLRGR